MPTGDYSPELDPGVGFDVDALLNSERDRVLREDKEKEKQIKILRDYIRDNTPIDGSPLTKQEKILFKTINDVIDNAGDWLVSMHESIQNDAALARMVKTIEEF